MINTIEDLTEDEIQLIQKIRLEKKLIEDRSQRRLDILKMVADYAVYLTQIGYHSTFSIFVEYLDNNHNDIESFRVLRSDQLYDTVDTLLRTADV